MLKDLIQRNRSTRRFAASAAIEREALMELVDLARLSASGANLQPLRYVLSCDAAGNARVFPCLGWAGYLPDWPGPDPTERPAAYITLVADTAISASAGCDHGIAAQSIMLGAAEKGLAGCMIGSIDRDALRRALALPDQYDILLVLALGRAAEEVVIEDVPADGSIRYWRDLRGVHHVPKRTLAELIIG